MKRMRNQKGFTIMELLIVIVIIGILIAIAVPAYQNFRERAQLTACQANRRTVKSAWGLWVADGNTPPVAGMTNAQTVAALTPYMGTFPTCPVALGVYSITDASGAVHCSTAAHAADV